MERDPDKEILEMWPWQRVTLEEASWNHHAGKGILGRDPGKGILERDPGKGSWKSRDAQNSMKNPKPCVPKIWLPNPGCTKPQFPTPLLPALFLCQSLSGQCCSLQNSPRNFQSCWKGSKGWLFQMTPEKCLAAFTSC